MTPAEFMDHVAGKRAQLTRYAQALTHDREEACELVQATLLRVYDLVGTADGFTDSAGHGGDGAMAWTCRIMRNAWFDRKRHERRYMTVALEEHVGATLLDGIHAAESRQNARVLLRAFERLQPEQRRALVLTVVGGLSFKEAGARMGVAEGTIKSMTSRGRARMAEIVGYVPEKAFLRAPQFEKRNKVNKTLARYLEP